MTLKQTLEHAQRGPLSVAERESLQRALDLGEPANVTGLELVEATAEGAARLSEVEAARMLGAVLKRPARAARWWPVTMLAAAAVLAVASTAVLLNRPAAQHDGLKGVPAGFTLTLVAQVAGEPVGRVVQSPVRLQPGEALRFVGRLTGPQYVALFEAGPDTRLVWSSGPLPAGEVALGPGDGHAGLMPDQPGRTTLWVVASPAPVPASLDPADGCAGCTVVRVEVER